MFAVYFQQATNAKVWVKLAWRNESAQLCFSICNHKSVSVDGQCSLARRKRRNNFLRDDCTVSKIIRQPTGGWTVTVNKIILYNGICPSYSTNRATNEASVCCKWNPSICAQVSGALVIHHWNHYMTYKRIEEDMQQSCFQCTYYAGGILVLRRFYIYLYIYWFLVQQAEQTYLLETAHLTH